MQFITDRTQQDIDLRTAKAYINAADLNRIWDNAREVGAEYGLSWPAKIYAEGELPGENADWRSLSDAVEGIRNAAPLADAPTMPRFPQIDYTAWNALESIILGTHQYHTQFVSATPRCGEISAGAQIGVL